MNTLNSVNSVNKPNKTPARAINFVGNKNKTEDRKTVEVAEALPALLLTLLPQSLLRACAAAVFFLSAHTHLHIHTRDSDDSASGIVSVSRAKRTQPSYACNCRWVSLCVCV